MSGMSKRRFSAGLSGRPGRPGHDPMAGAAGVLRALPMPESEFPGSPEPASPPAESETRSIVRLFEVQPPKEKRQIKFIKASGKTYCLSFDSCKTWQVRILTPLSEQPREARD